MNYAERWKFFLKSKNLTIEEFADTVGISKAVFFRWKKFDIFPDQTCVKKIRAKYPDLSWDWLLFGQGEPFVQPNGAAAKKPAFHFSVEGAPPGTQKPTDLSNLTKEQVELITFIVVAITSLPKERLEKLRAELQID